MYRTAKDIFSSIRIAQKTRKKLIVLKVTKEVIAVLKTLWEEGYIYGYKLIDSRSCNVFIKPVQGRFTLFQNLTHVNETVKAKKVLNLQLLQKSSSFFLITDRGFLSQKSSLKKKVGGKLVIKI